MGLLFTMHLLRREHDLHIYSFRGLEEIILVQLKHARSALNFKVILHPLTEGKNELIFDDDVLTVHTIPLDHKIPTSGFIFREKTRSRPVDKSKLSENIPVQYLAQLKRGEDVVDDQGNVRYRSSDYTLPPRRSRSYAYCSDSQPTEAILPIIKGVDLLYHEATFMEDEKDKARDTKHSTAAEAATIAKTGRVQKLLIGHFSARYKDLNIVLTEATKIFPDTALAIEGETFEITD
jgi:ribonuclease Z